MVDWIVDEEGEQMSGLMYMIFLERNSLLILLSIACVSALYMSCVEKSRSNSLYLATDYTKDWTPRGIKLGFLTYFSLDANSLLALCCWRAE